MPKTDLEHELTKEENTTPDQKIRDFSCLLDGLKTLSEKKKRLWIDIYSNAIIDRNNSSILMTALMGTVITNSTEHAIHGPNINKYIACMAKANDQIIRLAELIQNAEELENDDDDEPIDTEELYKQIQKK